MAANAAKKKRPEEEVVEEEVVEEEMHLAFRGTANALSQVYTHAVAHQKASFLAGERRVMENVHRWLSSQHEEASEVPVAAVLTYLQNEIEHRPEVPLPSPQHPVPQPACNFPVANAHCNPFSFGNIAAALDSGMDETDKTRNAGISNALPCPLQQNFHSNNLSQSSGYCPVNSLANGNGPRNNHSSQNQDFVNYNLSDATVDMHYDGQ